jgi:hypothetical protein
MKIHRWIFLLVLTGCLPQPSCDLNTDPCPGHGSSSLLEASNCDCPLDSDIGPQLQNRPCSTEGLYCFGGSYTTSNSCRCERGLWNCDDDQTDLAVRRDLEAPDLETPDLQTDDLHESD